MNIFLPKEGTILPFWCVVLKQVHTSIWSCGSGTRFWPARPSSSGSWPELRARRWPGTSAGGSASPARRSGLWKTRFGAFFALGASCSGTGVLSAAWRQTAPEPLERERERRWGHLMRGRMSLVCVLLDICPSDTWEESHIICPECEKVKKIKNNKNKGPI